MDIVVELEDGSIANVEMQKIGYLFPGQRCACYSADLLLRQYKMVRGEKKKKLISLKKPSYRNFKPFTPVQIFKKYSCCSFSQLVNLSVWGGNSQQQQINELGILIYRFARNSEVHYFYRLDKLLTTEYFETFEKENHPAFLKSIPDS